jgi:hypothetical protein
VELNEPSSQQPVWPQPTGPATVPSIWDPAAATRYTPDVEVDDSLLDATMDAAPKKRRVGVLAGAVAAVAALGVGAFLVAPRSSQANYEISSAGATTLEAESINVTFSMNSSALPQRIEFDGVIDIASGNVRAKLPLDSLAPGVDGAIDYVYTNEAAYIRYPDAEDLPAALRLEWIRMDIDEALASVGMSTSPMAGNNPLTILEGLTDTGDAKDLGLEDLDGEQVKRFELPAVEGSDTGVEVVVDADNRVREVSFSVNLDGLVRGAGQVDYTIRYLDFGGPVEITVPDDADTIPFSEAMSILGM